jgi:hypothetical protein
LSNVRGAFNKSASAAICLVAADGTAGAPVPPSDLDAVESRSFSWPISCALVSETLIDSELAQHGSRSPLPRTPSWCLDDEWREVRYQDVSGLARELGDHGEIRLVRRVLREAP